MGHDAGHRPAHIRASCVPRRPVVGWVLSQLMTAATAAAAAPQAKWRTAVHDGVVGAEDQHVSLPCGDICAPGREAEAGQRCREWRAPFPVGPGCATAIGAHADLHCVLVMNVHLHLHAHRQHAYIRVAGHGQRHTKSASHMPMARHAAQPGKAASMAQQPAMHASRARMPANACMQLSAHPVRRVSALQRTRADQGQDTQ